MSKIRTLIVDDSVVYRSVLRAALSQMADVGIEVVSAVSSGRIALQVLENTDVDLIILDQEMPEMTGSQTVKALRERKCEAKILMFSSVTSHGAKITLEALRLGASDFITKPGAEAVNRDGVGVPPVTQIAELLRPKIESLFFSRAASMRAKTLPTRKSFPVFHWDGFKPQAILIGSSTGGPTVLESIFGALGQELTCPVFVVQHMPPVFTAAFAERLSRLGKNSVMEGKDGMLVEPNGVYVAPGGYHMSIAGDARRPVLELSQGAQVHSVRPAVDPLFFSAAKVFGKHCLAFVLTGMGADGRDGAMAIKAQGGAVVIQEEKSCVVFGMPGAVEGVGAFDRSSTPEEIVQLIRTYAGRGVSK